MRARKRPVGERPSRSLADLRPRGRRPIVLQGVTGMFALKLHGSARRVEAALHDLAVLKGKACYVTEGARVRDRRTERFAYSSGTFPRDRASNSLPPHSLAVPTKSYETP
jgi:hypothetical protein